MRIAEFGATEVSTSRCFLVEADDGKYWVVRALWHSDMAKRAVNQFVAGTLAAEYGLNAPRVELIALLFRLEPVRKALDGTYQAWHSNNPEDFERNMKEAVEESRKALTALSKIMGDGTGGKT